MAQRHPQPTTPQTAPADTTPIQPPLDLSNIPQLLQQLLSDPNLDPHTLAQAIERLLLAQTLQTLADPTTPPPQRAAALQTYHQWRTTELHRQRLELARERLEISRQRLEISRQRLELQRQRLAVQQPPPTDTPDTQIPTDPEELDKIILDQLDQILGLKPRTSKPISPNPAPPRPPPPPPDPQNPP